MCPLEKVLEWLRATDSEEGRPLRHVLWREGAPFCRAGQVPKVFGEPCVLGVYLAWVGRHVAVAFAPAVLVLEPAARPGMSWPVDCNQSLWPGFRVRLVSSWWQVDWRSSVQRSAWRHACST